MTDFTWPGGKRAALTLTFDDARATQIDHGLPILDAHGLKATFYVSLGPMRSRLEEWRAAFANGHEVGNHTVSHPCSGNFAFSRHNALEDYTLDRIEEEITGANREIESLLGVKPATFAYPCGQTYVGRGENLNSYIPLVARHFLAGRGFNGESANHPAVCDLAHLLSTSADRVSWEELRPWLDSAVEQGDWLILTAHEVGPEPWHQIMTTDTLEAVCRYATDPENGVWAAPVRDVAEYVRTVRGE
jgi:peptidoglycan-N-acetylglucosamine deacetylase